MLHNNNNWFAKKQKEKCGFIQLKLKKCLKYKSSHLRGGIFKVERDEVLNKT